MGESGRQFVALDTLRSTCAARLTAVGVSRQSAERVVEEIVDAEISGRATHGVVRVPWLASKLAGKKFSPPVVSGEGPHFSLLHCEHAIGYEAAQIAAERCTELASDHGAHVCICSGVFPTGVLGYYLRPALQRGLVAFAFASTPPLVSVTPSPSALLGTEPIAIGIPVPGGDPVLCDATCAPATFGELLLALHDPDRFDGTKFVDTIGHAVADPRALFSLDGSFKGSIRGPDPRESPRSFSLLVGLRLLSIVLGGSADGGCLVVGALRPDFVDAAAPHRLADLVAQQERSLGLGNLPGRRSARRRREALDAGAISLPSSIAHELGISKTA